MNAYREWVVTVWGMAELELDEADLTPLTIFQMQSFPPPLDEGELIRGHPADAARDLTSILRSRKLISD